MCWKSIKEWNEQGSGEKSEAPLGASSFPWCEWGCRADSLSSYVLRACLRDYICSSHSIKASSWDFPGGPGAKTPQSQCGEPGFDPWSGN